MASFALARVYQQSFESHPYGTLAVTNGTLNAIGDVVAQITQSLFQPQDEYHSPVAYDIPRTLRFFAFGLGMGPLIGRWNLFLEQRFPLRFLNGHKTGSVSVKALTKRVASDQIIMAPIGVCLRPLRAHTFGLIRSPRLSSLQYS
ncbi:hypothetical protein NLI96_g8472 [Meripilus lineatus]|uniref:Uncharacterized protein n=1 Tax=Meripilus lineatus TaxID=2056292 RepID=A0AAD5UZ11_9APHY|nr:hypothetical protein NLI96_g8472 [Physisporinus lineatus]